ncbi:MAG: 2-amino-4-hydroxy-6-hydroxymethyldihydropteridine diphosphokinase [Thermodesulfobacteriota bacterium]
MFNVFIGIGSNLGNRTENCIAALESISAFTIIKTVSSFYETEPVGNEDQPKFINAVAKVNTLLSPLTLLNSLKTIENQMGRERSERWGPRTIDLDILFYEDFVLESQELTIPHKHLHKRKFVLEPICEIEPWLEHPVSKQSVSRLLKNLEDERGVNKIGNFYVVDQQ